MNKSLLYSLGCLGVIIVIAIIVAIGLGADYNKLVKLDQAATAQWAQVQNVYQRRADLIPNLEATVSGAANFEKSTLTEVVNARAQVGQVKLSSGNQVPDAAALESFSKAQDKLSSSLARLLVVVEKYPELKSNQNFLELQSQLEGSENRISVERGRFNQSVQEYNSALKSLPTVFYAGFMGFKEKAYFSSQPGAETAPKVQFEFNNK